MHISLGTNVLIVIQLDMFMELWKFSHVPLSLHPGDILQICFSNLAPERGTAMCGEWLWWKSTRSWL